MQYFAARDIKKAYPLNLELRHFTQPSFFKFCMYWFSIPIPLISSLQFRLSEQKTIESVLLLLTEAKNEIDSLPQSLNFLPDWLLFRPLNNWISHFFRVQKNELKRSLWAKIEEATLKSPGVLQRDDEVDQKITQCIEHQERNRHTTGCAT